MIAGSYGTESLHHFSSSRFSFRVAATRVILGQTVEDLRRAPNMHYKVCLRIASIDLTLVESARMAPDLSIRCNVALGFAYEKLPQRPDQLRSH